MLKNIYPKIRQLFQHKIRWWKVGVLTALILLPAELLIFSSGINNTDELYWKSFLANNKVYGAILPDKMDFAGEPVPLHDFTVIESMERELLVNTYFHSQTLMVHKRAGRWLPIIESILKKNGVPDDFKYIPLIESNLMNTISPKGATGFWQFLEPTAKQYGLEINEDVDERYHIERSTEAACRYFKDAYRAFGNWTMAAASYNVGIEGLKKQIDKQKTTTYYDLSLNDETARYVFRILAVKEILSNPRQYGYQLRKKDIYPPIPTDTFSIDTVNVDLADLAIRKQISYKILKYFNPWLRKNLLVNKNNKRYVLQIPKPGFQEAYMARLTSSDTVGVVTGVQGQDSLSRSTQ